MRRRFVGNPTVSHCQLTPCSVSSRALRGDCWGSQALFAIGEPLLQDPTQERQPGDDATYPFGLAAPGGVVSTTGVAGLTLNDHELVCDRRADPMTRDRLRRRAGPMTAIGWPVAAVPVLYLMVATVSPDINVPGINLNSTLLDRPAGDERRTLLALRTICEEDGYLFLRYRFPGR